MAPLGAGSEPAHRRERAECGEERDERAPMRELFDGVPSYGTTIMIRDPARIRA
jgi:hypothetical protein